MERKHFEPTVGNESLHEIRNVNEVRIINRATSVAKFINTLGLILMGKLNEHINKLCRLKTTLKCS